MGYSHNSEDAFTSFCQNSDLPGVWLHFSMTGDLLKTTPLPSSSQTNNSTQFSAIPENTKCETNYLERTELSLLTVVVREITLKQHPGFHPAQHSHSPILALMGGLGHHSCVPCTQHYTALEIPFCCVRQTPRFLFLQGKSTVLEGQKWKCHPGFTGIYFPSLFWHNSLLSSYV